MPRAPPAPRLQASTGPPARASPLRGAQLSPRAPPIPRRPTSGLSGPGLPRGRDRSPPRPPASGADPELPEPHPRQHQPCDLRARTEPPMPPPVPGVTAGHHQPASSAAT
ncbi:hypothetical protein NDU88_001152 [Pleurodeles waltl]|uniref:Uncharacterized protein n=1 Tax=Pleurodeles waltl TaxID=8319 RepID=A0AAV7R9Z2_PLEWA|nr:hypothetical protein NDU88_001152 [Pleurodeles waltl]